MRYLQVTVGAVAFSIMATLLSAQNIVKWGDSGAWEIYVDPAAGDGCLMQRNLEDGSRIQIGTVPLRRGGFIAVLNKTWTDVEEGATAVPTFDFDGELFAGEAVAVIDGEWRGGYAFFNNPEFVYGISKRQTLIISGSSGRTVTVDLTGTKNAVDAVKKCQDEQDK